MPVPLFGAEAERRYLFRHQNSGCRQLTVLVTITPLTISR